MLSMILKTLVRALVILFPVAYLSFGQSSSLVSGNTTLVVLLIFFLALGLALWARKAVISKNIENENLTGAQSMSEQSQ